MLNGAIVKFAEKHNVEKTDIKLILLPVNEDLDLAYSLMVKDQVQTDENGDQVELDFNLDILGEKYDPLGRRRATEMFLKNKIPVFAEIHDKHPLSLLFLVYLRDPSKKDIAIDMYDGSFFVKEYDLGQIFDM